MIPDKLSCMVTEHRLIKLLSDGHFHSGTRLGEALGVSRSAVWKHVQQLQASYGLDVQAVQGKGYRLSRAMDLLDRQGILDQLGDESGALLASFETCYQLDSTNRYLVQQTDGQGSAGAQVVLAEMQTAGRGRRGRNWVSPFAQNIYLSLAWHFDDATMNLSGLSLAVGVAVVKALKNLGIEHLQLKWPNDIYYQGRKLGGILLELRGEAGGACDVVVGLGLNVSMSARDGEAIDQAWIDIHSISDTRFSRNKLVAVILDELLPCMQLYAQQGLAPFVQDWQADDMLQDKPVTLLVHQQQREGIARGINEQGALLFESDGNLEPLYAGELSLRLSSSARG